VPAAGKPALTGEYHPDGGPELTGLLAELAVTLGSLKQAVNGDRPRKPVIPWEACHPVPILGTVQLTAGAGTLDQPDMYGPKDPYWWDLRSLGVWGFTAGTVTVFLNSANGQQLAAASTPGEFDWSAQRILGPRDRLIFVAAGITGTAQLGGQAIEVETSWLAEYLL